jgi:hypothetical protein
LGVDDEFRPFQLALQAGIFRFQTTHLGSVRVRNRTAFLAQRSRCMGGTPLTNLGVGDAFASKQ